MKSLCTKKTIRDNDSPVFCQQIRETERHKTNSLRSSERLVWWKTPSTMWSRELKLLTVNVVSRKHFFKIFWSVGFRIPWKSWSMCSIFIYVFNALQILHYMSIIHEKITTNLPQCISYLPHFEVERGKNYHKLEVKYNLPHIFLKYTTTLW